MPTPLRGLDIRYVVFATRFHVMPLYSLSRKSYVKLLEVLFRKILSKFYLPDLIPGLKSDCWGNVGYLQGLSL